MMKMNRKMNHSGGDGLDPMQQVILFALTVILVMGAFCVMVIWRMQQTIDTLSSKLMAKDYREYVVSVQQSTPTKERKTHRLSYWDDEQEVEEEPA